MNKKSALQRLFGPDIKEFVEKLRPEDIELRKKLDVGYIFEKQDLIIYELRPGMKEDAKGELDFDFDTIIQIPSAKAKFIKSKNIWRIYWHRANNKWAAYIPHPEVKELSSFFKIIDEDKYSCFWG